MPTTTASDPTQAPSSASSAGGDPEPTPPSPPARAGTLLGAPAIKWVFALEYVMQGLANPFQGITYQSIFRHFRLHYDLSEAATQSLFAKSYLAWSFKPMIGFLIDAYGRTRTLLIALLGISALGFALVPFVDTSASLFFAAIFALSVTMAATDVAVDRATIIAADEESRATGRSKAATVGLNQAICFAAVYGTLMFSGFLGGYVADHVAISALIPLLGLVPLTLLLVVLRLPSDRGVPIPIRQSIGAFWRGLHCGPILAVLAFVFLFHLQPALQGPLWNNHLIEQLHFTQTEVGVSDGMHSAGALIGVLLFAWKGVRWQDRIGMRQLFRLYIIASVFMGLTQYTMVDPAFSSVARALHGALPFLSESSVRVTYLALYTGLANIPAVLIRMSTFSLVGSVIPVSAAGSLFAGFMSVVNLAYSLAYASGGWLYDHGLELGPVRAFQSSVFGLQGQAGQPLSMQVLIFLSSMAFLASFVCVRFLPDRAATRATHQDEIVLAGPERYLVLEPGVRRALDGASVAVGLLALGAVHFGGGLDWISALLSTFFGTTMLRKAVLDALLRRHERRAQHRRAA
jgi:MFS family permease